MTTRNRYISRETSPYIVNMPLIPLLVVGVVLCGGVVVFGQVKQDSLDPAYTDLLCRSGDLKCYRNSAQQIVDSFATTGAAALNLKPFDPLHFDILQVERNWSSPVSVELTMHNGDILGVGASRVLRVSGLDAQLRENLEMDVFIPHIVLRGAYEMSGELYKVPIVGRGEFEMVLENTFTESVALLSPVQRGDRTYVHVTEVRVEKWPERVHFNLTGLYNGNKELSKRMLGFMNHNGVEIYRQWAPTLERAKCVFFQELFDKVLSTLPYEKFFLNN